jgi:hypothetical protein
VPDNRLLPGRPEDRSYAAWGGNSYAPRNSSSIGSVRLSHIPATGAGPPVAPGRSRPAREPRTSHAFGSIFPAIPIKPHHDLLGRCAGAVATTPAGPCSFLVLPSTRGPPFVGLFSLIVRSNGYAIDRSRAPRAAHHAGSQQYRQGRLQMASKAPWLSRSKRSLISRNL